MDVVDAHSVLAFNVRPQRSLHALYKSSATLTLVDAECARVIDVLPTGVGPHEVDVSPDGRTAVVANYGFIRGGNSLTVIDVPSATVTDTISLGEHSRPHGVVWLRDNRRVAVTAQSSKHLLVVDVAAGKITAAYPTDQGFAHGGHCAGR